MIKEWGVWLRDKKQRNLTILCEFYLAYSQHLAHSKSQIFVELKEETDRTGSILKAGLHLGLDCGLWATCPVSMEKTYQLENQTPQMKEPQGSYLDSQDTCVTK